MNFTVNPLVSILIPCYNAEKWLAQTISSSLCQTWNNIEIIVVDDGSNDQSLLVAKGFESTNVKVFSQLNRGASTARNLAYKHAQGEFIQYLDADDLLDPNKIERQIQLLENNTEYVASGEWARFYKTTSEAQFTPQPIWTDLSPVDWLVSSWDENGMMHPAAWLLPRKIADNAGLWNEELSLNDDGEYFSRVVLASKGVKFCLGAKSYYRSGDPTSLSGSRSREAIKSAFISFELGSNSLLNSENSPRTRRVCANLFQRFIYEFYPDSPNLLSKAEAKVLEFGGSDVQPIGSPIFNQMKNLVGWQLASRVQKLKRNILDGRQK